MKKILLTLFFCVSYTSIGAVDLSLLPIGDELYEVLALDIESFIILYQTSGGIVNATFRNLSTFEQDPFLFAETSTFETLKKDVNVIRSVFGMRNMRIVVETLERIKNILTLTSVAKLTHQDEPFIKKLIELEKYAIKQDWEAHTGMKSWELHEPKSTEIFRLTRAVEIYS